MRLWHPQYQFYPKFPLHLVISTTVFTAPGSRTSPSLLLHIFCLPTYFLQAKITYVSSYRQHSRRRTSHTVFYRLGKRRYFWCACVNKESIMGRSCLSLPSLSHVHSLHLSNARNQIRGYPFEFRSFGFTSKCPQVVTSAAGSSAQGFDSCRRLPILLPPESSFGGWSAKTHDALLPPPRRTHYHLFFCTLLL